MTRKSLFVIGALSTAVITGITPVTVQAASARQAQIYKGKGYVAVSGSSMKEISEALKELGVGNGNIICPPVQDSDGTPSVKPETKPETKPESKPETKPETKPENKPESKPESKPETKPETKPESTPEENEITSQAQAIVKLVNAERAKAGLPALKLDAKATAAANVRAKEIQKSFSHTRPDGRPYYTALNEQGISYRMSGENIAWGQKTAEKVMNAWMGSEGHRANILHKGFQNIGVGYYQDEKGVNHWVQLFTS